MAIKPDTAFTDWMELIGEPSSSPVDKLKQAPVSTYWISA
jgi:hypothetical protein